jgi:enolase
MQIKSIKARKIKDSRNDFTIEVSVNGQKASSPSGKSTGKYETPSYNKSLEWNINAINSLKIPFQFNSFSDLKKLESFIKKKFSLSTPKKFGANALVALEIAILKALAKEKNLPLYKIVNPKSKKIPVPLGNAIGGGLHSHNSPKPEFQEFLLIPQSKSISKNVTTLIKLHKKLKTKSINDEGAWQTSLTNDEVLSLLQKEKEIKIGIDVAASSFYKNKEYKYKNIFLSTKAQINYINHLIKTYNIFYIEDPIQELDFKSFSKISKKTLVTGDDLTATQISRLKKAIKLKSINAMIIKPNQNGSLIELQEIFKICKKHNIKTILSHRSGETLDTALADLAVGYQADYIKTGIATPYRMNKLKRLIQIGNKIKNT